MTVCVLQLAPYPTNSPRHGGQLRAHHTRRVLEGAGIPTQAIEIFRSSQYPDHRPHVDIDGAPTPLPYSKYWQIADFASGVALASDPHLRAELAAVLDHFYFDLIILEEPWLWPAVRRAGKQQPIIYNSYNVEGIVKRDILREAGAPDADALADEIEQLERSLCEASMACSAVTTDDAKVMQSWTQAPVVVAPNGTVRRKISHLRGILPWGLEHHERYVFYIASGHPPNISGFFDLAYGALRSLRSNERIVVAGSICDAIYQKLDFTAHHYLIRDRLRLVGKVSDYALSCLIANAAAIILPIGYGGGSNLKTAEALMSRKPIVATDTAFRGYERFKTMPNVLLGNDAPAFAHGIRRVLDRSVPESQPSPLLDELLWENTLSPIVDAVRSTRLVQVTHNDMPARQINDMHVSQISEGPLVSGCAMPKVDQLVQDQYAADILKRYSEKLDKQRELTECRPIGRKIRFLGDFSGDSERAVPLWCNACNVEWIDGSENSTCPLCEVNRGH